MAEPQDTTQDPDYVKPDPALNPRNQVLAEIAKTVDAQHKVEFAETLPSIDDDGNVTASAPPAEAPPEDAAPPAEPPAADLSPPSESAATPEAHPSLAAIDPAGEYEVVVEGVKVKVPGQKIIDAGIRTFQKETAADQRLKLASELLAEAEARVKSAPTAPQAPAQPPVPVQGELPFEDLATAIQFGTPEQAAAALKQLGARPSVTPEQVARLAEDRARAAARDEALFQDAMKFAQDEYGDLLSNDYTRRLFFLEESRRRAPKERGGEADPRPYKDLYKDIGDDLRKNLNLPKPLKAASQTPTTPASGSVTARQERKAAAPSVPRTAASRLAESSGTAKVKTPGEIIAAMAASRGKDRLTTKMKE